MGLHQVFKHHVEAGWHFHSTEVPPAQALEPQKKKQKLAARRTYAVQPPGTRSTAVGGAVAAAYGLATPTGACSKWGVIGGPTPTDPALRKLSSTLLDLLGGWVGHWCDMRLHPLLITCLGRCACTHAHAHQHTRANRYKCATLPTLPPFHFTCARTHRHTQTHRTHPPHMLSSAGGVSAARLASSALLSAHWARAALAAVAASLTHIRHVQHTQAHTHTHTIGVMRTSRTHLKDASCARKGIT
jgi:hypothetical protein